MPAGAEVTQVGLGKRKIRNRLAQIYIPGQIVQQEVVVITQTPEPPKLPLLSTQDQASSLAETRRLRDSKLAVARQRIKTSEAELPGGITLRNSSASRLASGEPHAATNTIR